MDKLIKWINGKIEQTSHLWYCWIGVICGIEIINVTLTSRYAPFWCDIVISILLLIIGGYYVSVFYKHMYGKYKSFLITNQSEILEQLSSFEKHIMERSEEVQKDLEIKYTELSLKVSDYKLEIKNEIGLQMENSQNNLLTLQNNIKEVLDNDLDALTKVQATVTETSNNINKAIDENFESARSNSDEKQNELNSNINRLADNLSTELKAIREEAVNISNQNRKEIIDETCRVSTDSHHKEMEFIDKIFNQVNKNHEGMIGQFDQAKILIVENIDRETSALNSNLIRIQEVINEKHFATKNQIEEVSNRVIESTDSVINSKCESLSEQLKETTESVVTQLNKDKSDLIEKARENKERLAEVLQDVLAQTISKLNEQGEIVNNLFTQAESRITENTTVVAEKLGITKDTISSLIELKQSEVFDKLEELNQESTKNLTALLDVTNSGIQSGIKDISGKIDQSSSAVSKAIVSEISTVKNEQSEISRLIDNLIQKEKERQSVVEQAMNEFQNKLELLQKETITEIAKSVNTVKAIEVSEANKYNRFYDMLHQVLEKDDELALSIKSIGSKQEETASKIINLETQMLTLNDLVKMLKKATSEKEIYKNEAAITKQDPNRKEKIYDAESGITVFNTFNNDVLKYSEMQQSGRKVFSADYDTKGTILSSKNYNNQGEVIIENSYHSNGQVKERKEKIKENGRTVTKTTTFDANGRKLS